jgi:hypothetical protein
VLASLVVVDQFLIAANYKPNGLEFLCVLPSPSFGYNLSFRFCTGISLYESNNFPIHVNYFRTSETSASHPKAHFL